MLRVSRNCIFATLQFFQIMPGFSSKTDNGLRNVYTPLSWINVMQFQITSPDT